MSVGPKESSPANNEKFQDMSKRKRTEETEKYQDWDCESFYCMTLGVKLRLSDQCSLADAYTSYTITIAITITLFKITVYCIRSLFYCYDQKKI